jgi:3-deoxy-D-manno-octulosonic-acid transferase
MGRRGGIGSGLRERVGIYRRPAASEPQGVVAVHAVSVGEVAIAAKLIRTWRRRGPERSFVLTVGTATGRAQAAALEAEGVRVVYAPLDLPWLVGRFLRRFRPAQLVLIESELWPNMLDGARRRGIPVRLANARLSPRSERRYRRWRPLVVPVLGMVGRVGAQEEEDRARWAGLGVMLERIEVTGSVKFDPGGARVPGRRDEFAAMLGAFGAGRPVVLAASTHAGEEEWIAGSVREVAPAALCVVVPRHAERRDEVKSALEAAGFEVVLRSRFAPPREPGRACLVVDSTGELGDWTAHAALVVIGKSILARGGQNPAEAVLAGVPWACGPWMENFRPLVDRMVAAGGCLRFADRAGLGAAVRLVLGDAGAVARVTAAARNVLAAHDGATLRTIRMLERDG